MSGLYEHMDGQCNRLESQCRRLQAVGSASVMDLEVYVGFVLVNFGGNLLLVWVCTVFS
ncbi:hypothetical protein D3C78_1630680 [compost metagenome]